MNTQEFRERLDALVAETAELLNQVDLLEGGDADELFEIADSAHLLKTSSGDLFSFYQDVMVEKIGTTPHPVSTSNCTIEIQKGSSRKSWDHDSLSSVVARRIFESSIDLDTGEMTKSPQDMMKELMKYGAISYWRVSALKDLNIDADDYCEVSEPTKKLVIRRNK